MFFLFVISAKKKKKKELPFQLPQKKKKKEKKRRAILFAHPVLFLRSAFLASSFNGCSLLPIFHYFCSLNTFFLNVSFFLSPTTFNALQIMITLNSGKITLKGKNFSNLCCIYLHINFNFHLIF